MTLVLAGLAVVTIIELAIWPAWRWRRPLAAILAILTAVLIGALLAYHSNVATVIFAILSLFRVVNLLRLVENRLHQDYLYHAVRKTSLWLIFYQIVVLGVDRLIEAGHVNMLTCFYIASSAQLAAALVIFSSTIRHTRTTKPPFIEKNIPSRDMPTVTVAIPARNETRDLEECLRTLTASNYPKLEILVLDDNSQEKRTPEIIRGFAQQGVRFLQGKQPHKDWLAKNYAYQQLADEANGKILLFCGVDTRFGPDTISSLVANMLHKNKTMASIMPRNLNTSLGSLLLQPARYAWELSLPRRLLGRPPVLSTCWLIDRQTFDKAGSFKAVSHQVVPESYFARYTSQNGDGYTFMRSDAAIGLSSLKTYQEQQATALRTRYPQLHRRPELIAVTVIAQFTSLVWPLLVGAIALISAEWLLAAISLLGFGLVAAAYSIVTTMTYQRFILSGLPILPIAALYDLYILGQSMWRYEFGEVQWKGRDVSQPVMQTIAALPKS